MEFKIEVMILIEDFLLRCRCDTTHHCFIAVDDAEGSAHNT
jgi:hypothetical protein